MSCKRFKVDCFESSYLFIIERYIYREQCTYIKSEIVSVTKEIIFYCRMFTGRNQGNYQ